MDKNILIITGEPSGDMRAGELLKELRPMMPGVRFWGIGGAHMRKQGAELTEDISNLSIVGAWEAVVKLPLVRRQYRDVAAHVREKKPMLAVLIDYPGFNLRVARFLHKENIPVVYYVIPQVWAWGRERVKLLKKYVSKALVLFKFEEDFLRQRGVNCQFVGHPLMDKAPALPSSGKAARNDKSGFTIALLPGSRKAEIQKILPVMLAAAETLAEARGDIDLLIAESSIIDKSLYDSFLDRHKGLRVSRVTDDTFRALERSDLAIVASGTATLEAAIMERPMVIVYRVAFLTAMLFRLFIRMSYIGLPNIVAGWKEVVPELLQHNATPEKLSGKVLELMNDPARMEKMREDLREVKGMLGEKGASRRAAEAVSLFAKGL